MFFFSIFVVLSFSMVTMFGRETAVSLPLGWDVRSYLKQPELYKVGHAKKSKESLREGGEGGEEPWPRQARRWVDCTWYGSMVLLRLGKQRHGRI